MYYFCESRDCTFFMHKRIRNIIIVMMAVMVMTSSLFVLLSHLLCEKCTDHISFSNNTVQSCCMAHMAKVNTAYCSDHFIFDLT